MHERQVRRKDRGASKPKRAKTETALTQSGPDFIAWGVPVTPSIEKLKNAAVVRLTGRLDAHGSAEVEPGLAVIEARSAVVMDLSGVSYISSAGIRVLVSLHKRLLAQGGPMRVAGLQPYCRGGEPPSVPVS